ncbi:hypothetical protein N9A86_00685 [Akkermansiaceae bacterium]|nr:hypothetical protein [Akkermansiaceae bacterium]
MKTLILIFMALLLGRSLALTLDELQQSYTVKRLKIVNAQETKIQELRRNYSEALGRIQQKYQKAGRLDDALLSKKEIDLVTAKIWPMPPISEDAPSDIISARGLYVRSYIDFQKTAGQSLVRDAVKMEALLAEKVISLTQAGDLEEAKKARDYQKSIESDPVLLEARALIQRVGNDGSSPVALQIRRAGDDLEVEVRYDSSGKISLQSPVGNVLEITGGKKEKGSTKAKNLGEFIGGKGFTVDPYVAYTKKFDDREIGPLGFSAVEAEFKKKQGGETGLKIQVAVNPKNIYLSLGDCLPVLSEKGTFRVEIRYFVPQSNKFINGLKFTQSGVAGPIPGSLTTKIGEWESFSFEAVTRSENPRLLMYLNSKERVKEPLLTGDQVLISHLQISHQSMSAYLVQKFDRDGGRSFLNPDADKQTLFALNGDLVSTN